MTDVAEPKPREFGLVLSIDGKFYLVERLPGPVRSYRLYQGGGKEPYTVSATEWGPTCCCPDQVYKREGLTQDGCKHIAALQFYGMI